jgi:hypothetical protein
VPIYDLITDATKKAAVKSAYTSYLQGKRISVSTALKEGTATIDFSFIGGNTVHGNDHVIETGNVSSRPTYWRLTAALSKQDNNNIKVAVIYRVWENPATNANYTEVEVRGEKTLAVNPADWVINENPLTWDSGEQWLDGNRNSSGSPGLPQAWWNIEPSEWRNNVAEARWLPIVGNKKFVVQVDNPSAYDYQVLGVQGTLAVHYKYME